MRKINSKGLELIKVFEGCKFTPYLDQKGIITVGFGHTGKDVHWGMHITPIQAEELLKEDLKTAETAVDSLVTVSLNDNEFAALVCFVYNIGQGAFKLSTLRSLLNQNKKQLASNEFLRWDHVNGAISAGLHARRKAEFQLFLEPV